MLSPYINGSQGEFTGTPNGLAFLLDASNRRTQELAEQAGTTIGNVVSGIVGATQASKQPQLFGPDTSPAGAAAQGFLMNYGRGILNNGDNSAAFSRLTNPGAGSPMSDAGMNFKRFAAMGKMADATFNAMIPNVPTTEDQEPSVNGVTPTQWKHMGTADKLTWFAGVKQANDLQVAKQAYDMGQQHLLELQKANAADTAFGQAMARARGNVLADTLNQGNGPVQPREMGMQDFANVATPEAWESSKAAPFLQEMAGRWRDKGARGVNFIKSPGGLNVAVGANGQFQFEPGDAAGAELLQTKPDPADIPPGHIAVQMGKGWKVVKDPSQWESVTTMDPNNNFAITKSEKYIGPQGAGSAGNNTGTPKSAPDARDTEWLKANPSAQRIATFEAKYGKGSATQFLK